MLSRFNQATVDKEIKTRSSRAKTKLAMWKVVKSAFNENGEFKSYFYVGFRDTSLLTFASLSPVIASNKPTMNPSRPSR